MKSLVILCAGIVFALLAACVPQPAKTIEPVTLPTPMLTLVVSATTEPTRAPTSSAPKFNGPWKTYRNDTPGIAFEYPAQFDTNPQTCGLRVTNNQIEFGVANLRIVPANGLSLDEYVNQHILKTDRPPVFRVVSRKTIRAHSTSGIAIFSYDSFLLYTLLDAFFIRDDYIYWFHTPAYRSFARFCDDDSIRLFHVDVYEHAITSFEFTKPVANVTIVLPTSTPTLTPMLELATPQWTPVFAATAAMGATQAATSRATDVADRTRVVPKTPCPSVVATSGLFDPHHHVADDSFHHYNDANDNSTPDSYC